MAQRPWKFLTPMRHQSF